MKSEFKIEITNIANAKLGNALRSIAKLIDDWKNVGSLEIILSEESP